MYTERHSSYCVVFLIGHGFQPNDGTLLLIRSYRYVGHRAVGRGSVPVSYGGFASYHLPLANGFDGKPFLLVTPFPLCDQ